MFKFFVVALQDLLPFLSELCRALDMQMELESLVEEGNYFKVAEYCIRLYYCCYFGVNEVFWANLGILILFRHFKSYQNIYKFLTISLG